MAVNIYQRHLSLENLRGAVLQRRGTYVTHVLKGHRVSVFLTLSRNLMWSESLVSSLRTSKG